MTIIEQLQKIYVGKTITGGYLHPNWHKCKIINVSLDDYEPIFNFTVLSPSGEIDTIQVLHDWNIEVS